MFKTATEPEGAATSMTLSAISANEDKVVRCLQGWRLKQCKHSGTTSSKTAPSGKTGQCLGCLKQLLHPAKQLRQFSVP